jgi:phosphoglycerate dehydrogenase-like enzyme
MPSRPNVFVLAHGDLCQAVLADRGRASLDVFDPNEPIPADHPLRDLPNVILTPHVSGPVQSRYWEMGQQTVNNVRLVCAPESHPSPESLSGAITAEQLSWMA